MNKRIMLAFLVGCGSYSCHADVSSSTLSKLSFALFNRNPEKYVRALELLKCDPNAFDDAKKSAIQSTLISWSKNVNINNYGSTIEPIFYFIFRLSFEELYEHILVQMKLIHAAVDKSETEWDRVVSEALANLSFLTEEEQIETAAYIREMYWAHKTSAFSND